MELPLQWYCYHPKSFKISSLCPPEIMKILILFFFISDSKQIHTADMSPIAGISGEVEGSDSEINKE